MLASARSIPWKTIGDGAKRTCRAGWGITVFEYRQAEEVRDAFARHGVRYLFIGKSGAILLGFPDTTQDADVFVEKDPRNGKAAAAALREVGFAPGRHRCVKAGRQSCEGSGVVATTHRVH